MHLIDSSLYKSLESIIHSSLDETFNVAGITPYQFWRASASSAPAVQKTSSSIYLNLIQLSMMLDLILRAIEKTYCQRSQMGISTIFPKDTSTCYWYKIFSYLKKSVPLLRDKAWLNTIDTPGLIPLKSFRTPRSCKRSWRNWQGWEEVITAWGIFFPIIYSRDFHPQ